MFQNKFFKSKKFVKAQLWVFNGLSVISLGFYFSLFSAGNPATFPISLQLAVIFFGVGLAANASLAFLFITSRKDPEFIDMLNNSRYFGWIPIVAIYSTGFAVLSLISFYSWIALIAVIFTMCTTIYLLYRTMQDEIKQSERRINEIELEKINLRLEILKNEKEKQEKSEK